MNEAQQVASSGVFPEFYYHAVKSQSKTNEKGIPEFNDVEMVRIRIAGDNKTEIERKVTEEDKRRWPSAYEAFKRTGSNVTQGYPLEQWPLLAKSEIAKLNFINVYTVEQLASLDDNGLSAYGPGGRDLKAQAQALLDTPSNGMEKLVAKNEQLETDNKFLKDQIKQMNEEIEKIKANKKK